MSLWDITNVIFIYILLNKNLHLHGSLSVKYVIKYIFGPLIHVVHVVHGVHVVHFIHVIHTIHVGGTGNP